MPRKLTQNQINYRANQFIYCKDNNQLAILLKLNQFELAKQILVPEYYYFQIPKTKGGYREIEAPAPELKKIQRKLNDYLQCIYYNVQSKSAYGFIINTIKQARNNKSKNIVSNAQKHLGNHYLLNIDFDDYFHQISRTEVFEIFRKSPFKT